MTPEQIARESAVLQLELEHQSRMRELNRQGEAIQRRMEGYAKESAVDSAMSGVEFINPTARAEARQLLLNSLHVTTVGDQLAVKGPTWEPAEQFIQQRLADPSWSHFLKPTAPATTTRAQTPSTTTRAQTPSTATPPIAPGGAPRATIPGSPPTPVAPEVFQRPDENLGQAFIRRWQEQQAAQPGGTDPRFNIRLPLGMRAKP
jgi:hypothetical protein